jgi:hypothetical protein
VRISSAVKLGKFRHSGPPCRGSSKLLHHLTRARKQAEIGRLCRPTAHNLASSPGPQEKTRRTGYNCGDRWL